MKARCSTVDARVGELATLFARGYLRLTQKRRNVRVSEAEKPQKPLEVCAPESVTVVGESAPEATP